MPIKKFHITVVERTTPYISVPATITQNTVLDGTYEMPETVTISNKATVTVTGVIYAAPAAQIIVKPGGKLIVNGGVLTNACNGEMWQGVVVEGNSSLTQIATNQGMVECVNGAIIENARIGISTCSGAKAGGITRGTDAVFKNNRIALYVYPYSSSIIINQGGFTRCSFLVDDNNILAANGLTFQSQVYISGISKLKFLV